jgi:hypothetical protein
MIRKSESGSSKNKNGQPSRSVLCLLGLGRMNTLLLIFLRNIVETVMPVAVSGSSSIRGHSYGLGIMHKVLSFGFMESPGQVSHPAYD